MLHGNYIVHKFNGTTIGTQGGARHRRLDSSRPSPSSSIFSVPQPSSHTQRRVESGFDRTHVPPGCSSLPANHIRPPYALLSVSLSPSVRPTHPPQNAPARVVANRLFLCLHSQCSCQAWERGSGGVMAAAHALAATEHGPWCLLPVGNGRRCP